MTRNLHGMVVWRYRRHGRQSGQGMPNFVVAVHPRVEDVTPQRSVHHEFKMDLVPDSLAYLAIGRTRPCNDCKRTLLSIK